MEPLLMTATASTRDRLIDTAHEHFYRDGFHGVGLDQILDEVGVTKTTFYNHFESKDELVLEILRKHDQFWRQTFSQKLREFGGDSPRDQLLAVFDVANWLFGSAEFHGCLFIHVAVEFPLPHDPIHQAAAAHKKSMEEILRQLAAYAGANDPGALAREISLVLEGMYVTQQVSGDGSITEAGRSIARLLLDKHLPQSK